jgi:hypothetical protein
MLPIQKQIYYLTKTLSIKKSMLASLLGITITTLNKLTIKSKKYKRLEKLYTYVKEADRVIKTELIYNSLHEPLPILDGNGENILYYIVDCDDCVNFKDMIILAIESFRWFGDVGYMPIEHFIKG